MNRRTFLKLTGTGIVVLGGITILSDWSGTERNDLPYDRNRELPIGDDMYEILHLASLAPSGHNTQPWHVKLCSNSHLIICSDKKRWLPAVDPSKRETLLSIGAFVENLVTAAGHYGYKAELNVLTGNSEDEDIIDVNFIKDSAKYHNLDKIHKRRTVRKNYLPDEIKSEDLEYITGSDSEHFTFFPANSFQGKYLSEGTVEANRIQSYRNDAQEELSNWIRWSKDDIIKYRDGLTPESMEIQGFAGWYVRKFYDKQSVLEDSFRKKTIEEVENQVKTFGGWIIITSNDSSVPVLLETGRLFERLFLKVRDRMIAIHPMTQMLEEKQFKDNVAKDLGFNTTVQFILRTGYLEEYPEPVSVRRPVNRFVRNNTAI